MRKKKLYVVGYDGDNKAIFGKYEPYMEAAIFPLTATQAKTEFKLLPADPVIYKLVKVDPKTLGVKK